jgi:leucyl/phenylalanyl-tRNA--protein transferase
VLRTRSLDPDSLLSAYAQGLFPMTDPDGVTRWYTANPRGVLPLDRFHIPATLRQTIRQRRFEMRINNDFPAVMRACMTVPRRRDPSHSYADGHQPVTPEDLVVSSWISPELIDAYTRLHRIGAAHSVESWQDGRLVGGLYGVSLGGAFFGESMFHFARDASKVALVTLVERLRQRGFALLDTQATTAHLRRFGCIEVPATKYLRLLSSALRLQCRFE